MKLTNPSDIFASPHNLSFLREALSSWQLLSPQHREQSWWLYWPCRTCWRTGSQHVLPSCSLHQPWAGLVSFIWTLENLNQTWTELQHLSQIWWTASSWVMLASSCGGTNYIWCSLFCCCFTVSESEDEDEVLSLKTTRFWYGIMIVWVGVLWEIRYQLVDNLECMFNCNTHLEALQFSMVSSPHIPRTFPY